MVKDYNKIFGIVSGSQKALDMLKHSMKPVINRADIIGGLKSVELAKKNPQNYQLVLV